MEDVEGERWAREEVGSGGVCRKRSMCPECTLDWLEGVGKVDIDSLDRPLAAVGRKSRSLRP